MPRGDVTVLLREWRAGDDGALEKLMEAVYDDLYRVAKRRLGGERPDHTLQPTALVHESYLRLIDQRAVDWQARSHFFAIAARTMRRILIDAARRRRAVKRGGTAISLTLSEPLGSSGGEEALDFLALNEALEKLAKLSQRQAKVVELRFFAGLTIAESAHVLDISPATVKSDWTMARAWLYSVLREPSDALGADP